MCPSLKPLLMLIGWATWIAREELLPIHPIEDGDMELFCPEVPLTRDEHLTTMDKEQVADEVVAIELAVEVDQTKDGAVSEVVEAVEQVIEADDLAAEVDELVISL